VKTPAEFARSLAGTVARYLSEIAAPGEHLSLLRWQIEQGHRLDLRTTYPGHVTTSAIILSPDHRQTLLIDHITIGRWLQPGGHYEDSPAFHHSAMREAEEETGVTGLTLHPWHRQSDLPFVIDSHDVPGKVSRNEPPHIHHDLQYLFVADPALPLAAQLEEVNAAQWCDASRLAEFAPKAVDRLSTVAALG
jgi:8-oxo-dGTP pyrophosphatase MutT (NUDIX family)